MKSIIFGAGSDLGVHIDGAHLGPTQLINDLQSFYKGEVQSFTQDEAIIKSRNLSDRRIFSNLNWWRSFSCCSISLSINRST